MKINLTSTIFNNLALVVVTILGFGFTPLLAHNSLSNATPTQTKPQHEQWMVQRGWMMNPGCCGSGGWGHYSQYGRMYDPDNLTTVSGQVVNVDRFTPGDGMYGGVHLLLKTGDETLDIHLGPAWYLQNQDILIEPGDQIEVTGSRINFAGQPALMAASVQKGDATLTLRDENGFPVWHGWRHHRFNF